MSAVAAFRLGPEYPNLPIKRDLSRRDPGPLRSLPQVAPQVSEEAPEVKVGGRSAQGTVEQGRQQAQELLNRQSALSQASILFESQRTGPPPQMTEVGRQRATMRGMTQMAKIAYHQGGGSYSKDQMGQMLSALQGSPAPQYFSLPRSNSPWAALG